LTLYGPEASICLSRRQLPDEVVRIGLSA